MGRPSLISTCGGRSRSVRSLSRNRSRLSRDRSWLSLARRRSIARNTRGTRSTRSSGSARVSMGRSSGVSIRIVSGDGSWLSRDRCGLSMNRSSREGSTRSAGRITRDSTSWLGCGRLRDTRGSLRI